MREVRLRFGKTGRLKYISHLDINRAMARAIKRAGIPLWYTEGFNPHPYMSFSLPLSLGVESLCESVDIRITGNITDDEIMRSMNAVLPDNLKIISASGDFRPSSEIAYSDYVFELQFDDNALALEKINSVLSGENIFAEKKAKQGKKRIVKTTDINPFIDRYDISLCNDTVVLNIRLCAGQQKNLNPTLLFDTILRLINMDFEWKNIKRTALLDKDYKEFL